LQNKDTILKFYKVMSVPNESRIMKVREVKRLQASEMKFLRNVTGYRTDHKGNDIREELNILNGKVIDYRKR